VPCLVIFGEAPLTYIVRPTNVAVAQAGLPLQAKPYFSASNLVRADEEGWGTEAQRTELGTGQRGRGGEGRRDDFVEYILHSHTAIDWLRPQGRPPPFPD
jgi:hypothetical protein